MDWRVIDRKNLVTGPQSGIGGGGIWRDVPGNDSGVSLNPRYPIIGSREHGPLLKIDDAKDNGRKGCQSENSRSQPNPEIVVDRSAHRLCLQSFDESYLVQPGFQII